MGGRNGGFFFFAGGIAGADEESGEKEANASEGASSVGGEGAGAGWVEATVEILEELQGPHVRISSGGEGVEENSVGCGNGRGAGRRLEPGAEIAREVGPLGVEMGGLEGSAAGVEELAHGGFVAMEVREAVGGGEGDAEGVEGAIETDEVECAWEGFEGTEGSEGIGGGAETDVPEDEGSFFGEGLDAIVEFELADVEGIGFGGGADDGVEGFAEGAGAEAPGAIGELDGVVIVMIGIRHGATVLLDKGGIRC